MRIYFNNLRFQNKPILWNVRKQKDEASCEYKIAGCPNPITPELLNHLLKDIDGIEIRDGIAFIVNLELYRQSPLTIDAFTQHDHLDFILLRARIQAQQVGNTTLKFALNELQKLYPIPALPIPNDLIYSVPENVYSLKKLIQAYSPYKKKPSFNEEDANRVIAQIIEAVLPDFIFSARASSPGSQLISNNIFPDDADIYLVNEWKQFFEDKFKLIFSSLPASIERKEIQHWQEIIIASIKESL